MGRRRRVVLAVAAALYLLGTGFLLGVAADRVWFDRQRAAVIAQYESALRRWREYLMHLEKQPAATSPDVPVRVPVSRWR